MCRLVRIKALMRARGLKDYLNNPTWSLPRKIGDRRAAREILNCYEATGGVTFNHTLAISPVNHSMRYHCIPSAPVWPSMPGRCAWLLEQFLSENGDLLEDPRHCIGIWHDVEADVMYVDISVVVTDRATAESLGRTYNQIEVYDLEAGEAIPTGGSGEVLPDWGVELERLPPLRRGVSPDDY